MDLDLRTVAAGLGAGIVVLAAVFRGYDDASGALGRAIAAESVEPVLVVRRPPAGS